MAIIKTIEQECKRLPKGSMVEVKTSKKSGFKEITGQAKLVRIDYIKTKKQNVAVIKSDGFEYKIPAQYLKKITKGHKIIGSNGHGTMNQTSLLKRSLTNTFNNLTAETKKIVKQINFVRTFYGESITNTIIKKKVSMHDGVSIWNWSRAITSAHYFGSPGLAVVVGGQKLGYPSSWDEGDRLILNGKPIIKNKTGERKHIIYDDVGRALAVVVGTNIFLSFAFTCTQRISEFETLLTYILNEYANPHNYAITASTLYRNEKLFERVKVYDQKIISADAELEKIKKRTALLKKNKKESVTKRKIILKGASQCTATSVDAQLSKCVKDKVINDYQLLHNVIIVKTNDIKCIGNMTKKVVFPGKYSFFLDYIGREIQIKSELLKDVNCSQHPHVGRSYACFGNIGSEMHKIFEDHDFEKFCNYAIAFVSRVQEDDTLDISYPEFIKLVQIKKNSLKRSKK
jgi:hypothetical protein